MYDALTARYTFACPRAGRAHVALSSFRLLERLPGAAHPAVYRVRFACGAATSTSASSPTTTSTGRRSGVSGGAFLDLMTSRTRDAADELLDVAPRRTARRGVAVELLLLPGGPAAAGLSVVVRRRARRASRWLGLAVRCPACDALSVNLVSHAHVDLPFANDERIGVVEHVFAADALSSVEEFHAELHSSRFDERRLHLN